MTAKHIIKVNGIDFNNDYINFREISYAKHDFSNAAYHVPTSFNVPTSKCFIYVWQKSNSLDEFEQNMQSLYDDYVKQHPDTTYTLYKSENTLNTNYYESRACSYRRKGVKLKAYPKHYAPPRNAKDWDSLADFASDALFNEE